MGHSHDNKLRQHVAREAARIMAVEWVQDFLVAKRKAAERLGIREARFLPNNREIEKALEEYQRLFRSDSQPDSLRHLREVAVKAMQFLDRYQPRLVGDVLSGSAGQHSPVQLHLFCDSPEEIAFWLDEARIPYEAGSKRVRVDRRSQEERPCYRFSADEVPVDLVVFDFDGLRCAPLSPVDGKPMNRADRDAVQRLLDEANGMFATGSL